MVGTDLHCGEALSHLHLGGGQEDRVVIRLGVVGVGVGEGVVMPVQVATPRAICHKKPYQPTTTELLGIVLDKTGVGSRLRRKRC